MKTKSSFLKLAALAALCVLLSGPSLFSANLVVNGSFETGPDNWVPRYGFVRLSPGNTSITGWTVTRATIDYYGPGWTAADGGRSIDMDGNDGDAGGVAQTISTTPGAAYTVTFNMASNPNYPPLVKWMRVSAAGQSADFSFAITGHDQQSNMGWVTNTWRFTAYSTSTTLEFYSLDPPAEAGRGPALDNVWVEASQPDLVATSLTWDAAQGGVDFQYEVRSNALPVATTAKLFWANGTNKADIVPGEPVIFTQNIPGGASGISASIPAPPSLFESRPAGATHILLVLDPDNLVQETDESNNSKALALNLPVVVLVRGYQLSSMGDPSNESRWQAMTAALGDMFEVWVCDRITGTETHYEAAPKLHDFIDSKVRQRAQSGLPLLKTLSIVAHSTGGVFSRAYIHRQNSEWPTDPRVEKLVTLGSPHCGTILADLGHWPFGVAGTANASATWSVTTGYMRDVFNVIYGDLVPPATFYLFGGTGGNSGWFKLTWPFLFYFPWGTFNPNDGVITAASAEGTAWWPVSREPPKWKQVQQVGGVLIERPDDHTGLRTDPVTLSIVRDALLHGGLMPLNLPKSKGPKDTAGSPPTTALVAMVNDTVQAGATAQAVLPIDDCAQATFSLSFAAGQVGFTLTTPNGATIDSSTTNAAVQFSQVTNELGVNLSYVIDNPPVGLWTANLQGGTNLTNGVFWSLLVTEESDLATVPTTEYFQIAGNVAVSTMLANGTQAVSGAVLSAAVQRPDGTTDQLPLYDDGTHGDGAASDGIYANAYSISTNAGIYSVRYSATGTNAQGHTFARVEGGSFQIAPRTAWLSGAYSDQGVDSGPPPGLEEVAVSVGVQVVTAGVYSVSAVLADAAGHQLASAAVTPTVLPMGSTNLTLHFDADGPRRSTNDGPYLLTSVVLWDDSSGLSLRADFATNAYSTAPYSRTNFSDRLPPSAVSDLTAASVGSQSVILRWTAPDNEGKAAASYSIRCRKGGLWPSVWDSATVLDTTPAPTLPGTQQTFTVGGLDIGNTYYFGIKSMDQAGNESDLSNVQMVRLLSAITSAKVLTNGQFRCSFAGEAGRSYVIQVSTNLTQWLPLSTNTIGFTNSSFVFTDSAAASFRQRFYRCFQVQ